MKLNLGKCNVGVLERKFLIFYVGKASIRPNPKKVKAIIDTTPSWKCEC